MLGLPPKTSRVFHTDNELKLNQDIILEWLKVDGFVIVDSSAYSVIAEKKCKHTPLSVLGFIGKPTITWEILFTEEGRVTIKSRHDYKSMYGVSFMDFGRQEKLLNVIEIIF